MGEYDLVLLHPPAVFDFKERVLGPISDVVPSYPVFDMYPIGFLTLTSYLIRKGFKVRIVNLAAKMLLNENLNIEKYLKGIKAKFYGIDFHWLIHANGALRLARIIKRLHPYSKIVIGGLSATYFLREVLPREYIDYVVLGDTGERTIELLLENMREDEIPNLGWKERDKVRLSRKLFVPNSLDEYFVDVSLVIRKAIRSGDPLSWIPYASFVTNPIGGVLPYKGCPMNCLTCGGSQHAYSKYFFRKTIARKNPKTVFEEIKSIADYLKVTIFILNDLQLLGKKWIEKLIKEIKSERIDNTFMLEFFKPPNPEMLDELSKLGDDVILQISPETHDEHVRKVFGRNYTNRELEAFIKEALKRKFRRIDLYFMIGLPKQDKPSVLKTVDYIDNLLTKYGSSRLEAFIAPLAPFLDPGSLAFENPEKYGYTLLARTLEDHMEIIKKARKWVDLLNYKTKWLSKKDVAEAFYSSTRKLVEIKYKHGIIGKEEYEELLKRIDAGRTFLSKGILDKESVKLGELYPSRHMLTSIKPLKILAHLPLILMGR